MKSLEKWWRFHAVVTALLVSYALYVDFLIVPNEAQMGAVQRIFYFHVGSAIACYVACAALFVCGLLYLARPGVLADIISEASAEVGLLFCTVVLLTGMIWGHSAWNTWFRWEPRLVTFLLLWFIFVALNLLRRFGDQSRISQHAAVLGVVAAVMVPIVVYSVQVFASFPQLHPQVVGNRGLKDGRFVYGMVVSMVALISFCVFLIWTRVRIGILERK